MNTSLILIIGLFVLFFTLVLFAIKNKIFGKHLIMAISLFSIFCILNIPSTLPRDRDLLIMTYIVCAFFSMVSLLILVPNNAKAHGKNSGLWGFFTLVTGPLAGLIYYVLSFKK
jgi:predicted membrane channel-forming protein YqfA (hemolysin III family)